MKGKYIIQIIYFIYIINMINPNSIQPKREREDFAKGIEKEIENFSTGSSDDKDKTLSEQQDNQRFCLRKRKSVNYNTKTKKFEFESDSDSEYEQKAKRSTKGYVNIYAKFKKYFFNFFLIF
jgi:hypothetical protein